MRLRALFYLAFILLRNTLLRNFPFRAFAIRHKKGRYRDLSKIIVLPKHFTSHKLNILEEGAKKMGLPLGSYLRTLGMEAAEKY